MPTLPHTVLQQDFLAVTHPDLNRPFQGKKDAFSRLAPYHIFQTSEEEPAQLNELTQEQILASDKAQADLAEFQSRIEEEEESTQHRLVAEKAFLEGLWAQEEQAARTVAVQKAQAISAMQVKSAPQIQTAGPQYPWPQNPYNTAMGSYLTHQNIVQNPTAQSQGNWHQVSTPSVKPETQMKPLT